MDLETVQMPMIRIAGTRVSLQQPLGFFKASNFIGLQRDGNTAINITDLNGGNYYTNAATFTRAGFEAKGMDPYMFEEMTTGGYPAKYAQFRGADGHTTHMLVFGDSTFSTMLIGTNLNSEPGMNLRIKSALWSATYDKDLVIDPFEDVPFILDDSRTSFRFASKGGGMFLYSLYGIRKPSYEDESNLIVGLLPFDGAYTEESVVQKNLAGMKQKGFVAQKTDRGSSNPLNGYPSYALVSYGTLNGAKTALLFQVVSHGDKAVLIMGRTGAKDSRHVKDFKKLIATLRFL